MPLLKDGQFIEDDWVGPQSADLPESGKIIVSLVEYMTSKDSLLKRNGALAVHISNDVDVISLQDELEHFDMIVVEFPAFSDGRAYSQARQLRSELDFKGELRAIGNILPDQLSFMRQCGIDVFSVGDRFTQEDWQKALSDISLSYQEDFVPESGKGPATILARRRQAREKSGS